MPRNRITRQNTRPQNRGHNRNVQMRNNARQMPFQQQNFQGGVGQGPALAPGQPAGPPRPGAPQPGAQQAAVQCPAGQKAGPMPDGRMGCVPDRQAGMPGAPGVSPARGQGAGIPVRGAPKKYNEGR